MGSMELSDATATIVSTVMGALIASIVSLVLARRTSRETLERDRLQRLDQSKSIAFRAMVNLKSIVDNLGTLRGMLQSALNRRPTDDTPLWTVVEPIVGHEDDYSVRFSSEEIALFIEAGRSDIAANLQLLAKKNATLGAAIETMNHRRQSLRDKMPTPALVESLSATTRLTREQYLELAPDMQALDQLIRDIVRFLDEDFQLALETSKDFGPALRSHFKDENFPALILPSESEPLVRS
jgi:hypothetical protein